MFRGSLGSSGMFLFLTAVMHRVTAPLFVYNNPLGRLCRVPRWCPSSHPLRDCLSPLSVGRFLGCLVSLLMGGFVFSVFGHYIFIPVLIFDAKVSGAVMYDRVLYVKWIVKVMCWNYPVAVLGIAG